MNFPMVCTCDHEDFIKTEQRRLRIFSRMKIRDMENLTSAIIMSLAFDFLAEVNLFADVWFGVLLKTPLLEEDGLYVQCDHPEEGLALLWEHLAEQFPERVSVSANPESPLHTTIAKGVSEHLLNSYVTSSKRYRGFLAKHGDRDFREYQNDPEYLISLELFVATKAMLLRHWGSETMREAIERAYEG